LYARRAYNLNMKPETKTSFTENIRAADASLANVAERRAEELYWKKVAAKKELRRLLATLDLFSQRQR